MMDMNLAELVVAFNPGPTASRVSRAKMTLVFRIISALISVAICVYIALTAGKDWSPMMMWGLFGVWGGVSGGWLIASIVTLVRATRDARNIGVGPAVVIAPGGISLKGRAFGWDEVSGVWLTGGLSGAGPRLVVQTSAGDWEEIPLSYLDASAGTIDSALRAYGQPGLSVSGLDAML